jgi:hypothetical protein
MATERDPTEPIPAPDLIRHAIVMDQANWAGRLTREWAHRCRSLAFLRPQLLLAIREGDADRAALCARLAWPAAQDVEPGVRSAERPMSPEMRRFRWLVDLRHEVAATTPVQLWDIRTTSRLPNLEQLDGDNRDDRLYE